MKVLAISKRPEGVAAEQVAEHAVPEAARVWEHYCAGRIRELYFCPDRPAAVVVLECRDGAEAREILGTLPMVKAGVLDFDILPLQPFDHFERLFRDEFRS
jgi:muconolactone delta-isomerase